MWKFLVDEDMPRSTARLRAEGHVAEDVRDVGLRGHSDDEVFQRAQEASAILVTADKGFTNTLKYPVGSHAGILVARIPDEVPTDKLNEEILRALGDLEGEEIAGALLIVEIGRTRLRRPR